MVEPTNPVAHGLEPTVAGRVLRLHTEAVPAALVDVELDRQAGVVPRPMQLEGTRTVNVAFGLHDMVLVAPSLRVVSLFCAIANGWSTISKFAR